MTPYDDLKYAYEIARGVCDPIQFVNRRDNLLLAIAHYLLERDKPVDDTQEKD